MAKTRGHYFTVEGPDGPVPVHGCGGAPTAKDIQTIEDTINPKSWAMARENLGLTLAEVAKASGLGPATLAAIEAGALPVDDATRAALAKVYRYMPRGQPAMA